MRVLDAGHLYELAHLDGEGIETLRFVKREGDGYPGNIGHYEGTNLQEVLRALIDRVKYLDGQIHDSSNEMVLGCLRGAIYHLEYRAARRHGRPTRATDAPGLFSVEIESEPTCAKCGHIGCKPIPQPKGTKE